MVKSLLDPMINYPEIKTLDPEDRYYEASQFEIDIFDEPVRIACLINKEDQSWSSDDFGSDINQSINFRFLKHELKVINLVPEVGDILVFKNNFYEVDTRVENQLIFGKDPDYAISGGTIDFGDSFSILLNTHLSRVEKLNLIPLREGKYPTTKKVDSGVANLLG